MKKRALAIIISGSMIASLSACGSSSSGSTTAASSSAETTVQEETAASDSSQSTSASSASDGSGSDTSAETKKSDLAATTQDEKDTIESTLNIANNKEITWTYDSEADAWIMSITSAVVNPEIEDEQGVSVAVPGAYVKGIDTDGDGTEDVTSDTYSEAAAGSLVIDSDAKVTSENGQIYTAATAPVIVTTGAAGYSEQQNQQASTEYAKDGYISVACGNRGKQSTATDSDGNSYYTGDAPLCLVDQKNAIRFVKYNIILGNLPGSTDYFVSTGGSGGAAHATMVAATSNNSDYYDYEIEAGAVGVYRNDDGTYSTTVSANGKDQEISDGVWGCVAYSAITSLAEADMDMAFEYYMNTSYDFNTDFQKALAGYLSEEYMDYLNAQKLSVDESAVGFDLNEDGDTEDTVDLTIDYDETKYSDTNGYGGTYLTLYLDEFEQNLEWYLDNLDYAEGWTWFDSDGNALSDDEVAAMTSEDKANAFIEGRYAKSESDSKGGPGGMGGGKMTDGNGPSGDMPDGQAPDGNGPAGDLPDGQAPDGNGPSGDMPDGQAPDGNGPAGDQTDAAAQVSSEDESSVGALADAPSGNASETGSDTSSDASSKTPLVGTPDQGTTQSSGSSVDSSNYSTYDEMLSSYESDIESIEAGDKYGNNIVDLYNPLNYIGDDDTQAPVWTRIMMGASEGDMSLFASLNLQIAWLNAGTDAELEWQWDGGHVPSEIFGESLSLYVDEMYGKYVEGAVAVTKAEPEAQTENGDASQATGTDISSWVSYDGDKVTFSLSDAAAYRTNGASKATPGFDVMDYGQETYEFGDSQNDARHFDKYVLQALQDHAEELESLFNASASASSENVSETDSE